jgi:hypothetical protein
MNLELASQIEIFSENGTRTPLADLWRDAPAVLAFVRHFG